jgi:hypothetical protein
MVINKTPTNLTSTVSLSGLTPKSTAVAYRYGRSNMRAIEHLADQAVTGSGFSATFGANSITLVELKPATAPTSFGDVPAGYWAKDFINGLYANGITTGCGTGTYCPTQNVTREQMAAFIIRAVEGEPAACTLHGRADRQCLLQVHLPHEGTQHHNRLFGQQLLPEPERDPRPDGGFHHPGSGRESGGGLLRLDGSVQ